MFVITVATHPALCRRTATAEAAVVEQAAKAQRAALERSRGLRRRCAASPRDRGLAGAPLGRGHAGGVRCCGMAAIDVATMYSLQHNYPAASTAVYFLQGILAG